MFYLLACCVSTCWSSCSFESCCSSSIHGSPIGETEAHNKQTAQESTVWRSGSLGQIETVVESTVVAKDEGLWKREVRVKRCDYVSSCKEINRLSRRQSSGGRKVEKLLYISELQTHPNLHSPTWVGRNDTIKHTQACSLTPGKDQPYRNKHTQMWTLSLMFDLLKRGCANSGGFGVLWLYVLLKSGKIRFSFWGCNRG